MTDAPENIFIIVPCYNEEARLKDRLRLFIDSPYRFIFVNGGSTDKTGQLIENTVKLPNYALSLGSNVGKAETVRSGMMFLRSLEEFRDCEWAGYWDADMAAPVSEIDGFTDYAASQGGADAVYGSRIVRSGNAVKRRFSRRVLAGIFSAVIRALFGIDFHDTQCGAKIFKRSVLEAAFGRPFISKWIFDVEIILRLKDFKQLEYPLRKWEDVGGSKIKPFRMLASVLGDIFRIYLKYRGNTAAS